MRTAARRGSGVNTCDVKEDALQSEFPFQTFPDSSGTGTSECMIIREPNTVQYLKRWWGSPGGGHGGEQARQGNRGTSGNSKGHSCDLHKMESRKSIWMLSMQSQPGGNPNFKSNPTWHCTIYLLWAVGAASFPLKEPSSHTPTPTPAFSSSSFGLTASS